MVWLEAIKAFVIVLPKLMELIVHLGSVFKDKRVQDLINESCEVAKLQAEAKTPADKLRVVARVGELWRRAG